MHSQFMGVATCVTHEVLAGVVSKHLVLYIKGAEKIGKIRNMFVPPMRGICLGTHV